MTSKEAELFVRNLYPLASVASNIYMKFYQTHPHESDKQILIIDFDPDTYKPIGALSRLCRTHDEAWIDAATIINFQLMRKLEN